MAITVTGEMPSVIVESDKRLRVKVTVDGTELADLMEGAIELYRGQAAVELTLDSVDVAAITLEEIA